MSRLQLETTCRCKYLVTCRVLANARRYLGCNLPVLRADTHALEKSGCGVYYAGCGMSRTVFTLNDFGEYQGALQAPTCMEASNRSRVAILARNYLELQVANVNDSTTRIYSADLVSPFNLGTLKASLVSLPPGTRIIPRAHSHSPMFIYVLAGSGICWYHGSPYDMGQNDCVGFQAGSGVGFAFINEGHVKESLEFLLLSEEHPNDTIAYFDTGAVSSMRSGC